MLRPGQYSLAYLFVESVWIALTVCFFRHSFAYVVAMPQPGEAPIWSLCAAIFCLSVSVGGLFSFRGMWAGAAIGAVLTFGMVVLAIVLAVQG
jgi:hypothetical protein